MFIAKKKTQKLIGAEIRVLRTEEKKLKKLDDLAVYCLLQTQEFFAKEFLKMKEKIPVTGKVDVAEDHYRISYLENFDGELNLEVYIVDKTMIALERFINERCEQYRMFYHFIFSETK